MTRPDSPLQRHLLTRSDLARMAVPAAVILAWLADGALEPVGILGDDTDGDPVFTVNSPELRRELLLRLAGIDKTAVVLTPMRVRSFLVRARLATTSCATTEATAAAAAAAPAAIAHESTQSAEHLTTVADRLASTDLANVLQEVAAEIEADVEVMLRLAEEEAQLEAEASQAQPNAAVAHEQAGDQADPHEVESIEPTGGDVEACFEADEDPNDTCFDIDDLAGAFEVEHRGAANEPPAAATDATAAATSGDGDDEQPSTQEPAAPQLAAIGDADDLDDALMAPPPRIAVAPTELRFEAATDAMVAPVRDEQLESGSSLDTSTTAIAPSCEPETNTMASESRLFPPSTPTIDEAFDALIAPAPSAVAEAGTVGELSGMPDALDAVLGELGAKPPATPAPTIAEASIVANKPAAAPTGVHVDDAVPGPAASPMQTAPMPASTAADAALAGAALASTNESLERVESFLGELRSALIDLAHRPAQPAIDMQPLVVAVQTGFEQATVQTTATNAVLTTLSDRIGGLGQQVEQGMQQTAAAVAARPVITAPEPAAPPAPTQFVVASNERTPIALLALAALVSGWSVLFWFKTGSIRLALGTLIAANLVGCCLLLARRQR
jgi:hypothetical protein